VDGKGEETWVTPTTADGALFDPEVADADGYGSTLGFYSSQQDGIDIGIEKNVGADVPGMHNPDDLEVHIRLAPQQGPGVLGVTTGDAPAVPSIITADTDDRVLLRLSGNLRWGLLPTAALADGAVTNAKIESVDWSKITNVPPDNGVVVTWEAIYGKPNEFPAGPHLHDLGGDLTGTTQQAQITVGAVTSQALAAGAVTSQAIGFGAVTTDAIAVAAVDTVHLAPEAVTTAKIAPSAVTNDRLANDRITIIAGSGLAGGGEVALGDSINLSVQAGPDQAVTSLAMIPGLGISHSDGRIDARTGDVVLGFYPYDGTAGPVKGNLLYCAGIPAQAANGQFPNSVLSFPVSGQRNALLVADQATELPTWSKRIELGTASDGGASLKINVAAGKYVEISSTGRVRCFESATADFSIDMAARTIRATFPNANSVTLAEADFVGTGKAVRLREIDVCDNGVARKMLILASAPY
jgi:hypothetical protein